MHVGKDIIAFESRMEPRYVFKKFDDSVAQEVDLSSVLELQMEYQILFTEKDDIHIIARKGDLLKVVHSDPENFATDAKRWRIMAEQQKIDNIISRKKEMLEIKQQDLKEKRTRMKTEELMRTVREHRTARQQERMRIIAEKKRQLQLLRERFASELIGKYEYAKAKKNSLKKKLNSWKTSKKKK